MKPKKKKRFRECFISICRSRINGYWAESWKNSALFSVITTEQTSWNCSYNITFMRDEWNQKKRKDLEKLFTIIPDHLGGKLLPGPYLGATVRFFLLWRGLKNHGVKVLIFLKGKIMKPKRKKRFKEVRHQRRIRSKNRRKFTWTYSWSCSLIYTNNISRSWNCNYCIYKR